MDRFKSTEDVEWNQGMFDDGGLARVHGKTLDSGPTADVVGDFCAKSWRAGWCDMDACINADSNSRGSGDADRVGSAVDGEC